MRERVYAVHDVQCRLTVMILARAVTRISYSNGYSEAV